MPFTIDQIREWQKGHIGHNNAPGCLVCLTINMLIDHLQKSSSLEQSLMNRRTCDDGVIITEFP
jgi:hypothetical protein